MNSKNGAAVSLVPLAIVLGLNLIVEYRLSAAQGIFDPPSKWSGDYAVELFEQPEKPVSSWLRLALTDTGTAAIQTTDGVTRRMRIGESPASGKLALNDPMGVLEFEVSTTEKGDIVLIAQNASTPTRIVLRRETLPARLLSHHFQWVTERPRNY